MAAMSAQSCIVVLAVVALLLAVIVNTTAFGAPKWLEGTTRNGSDAIHATRGLWQECDNKDCTLLVWALQPTWFRSVQAFFTIGTAMCIVTLVIFCSIFAINMSNQSMYLILGSVMITNIISSVCFCIALGVFAAEAIDDTSSAVDDFIFDDRVLGWAFHIAIFGVFFSLVTSVLLVWEGCMAANWFKVRPYYDL